MTTSEAMPFDLYQINFRAFGGQQLSREELDFATRFASSAETSKAITAHGILLLSGEPEQQRGSLNWLRDTCRSGKQNESAAAEVAMVSILEFLPAVDLNTDPGFKEFAYRVAKSSFLPSRINAMRVLRELAKMGDQQAAALLREATTDANPFVKEGAQTALRLVAQAGTSEGD